MLASVNGHVGCVSACLQHPHCEVNAANWNTSDIILISCYSVTPLMLAADNGHLECVREILKHPDCDVNATDNNKWTTLMRAVYKAEHEADSHAQIIDELLKQKDLLIKLDHAKQRRHSGFHAVWFWIIPEE